MSRLAFPFAAILSACVAACATTESSGATASASTPPTTSAPTDAPGCNADAAHSVVGQIASAEVVEQARMAAGAQIARTLKPGQMVTMEYHAGRLNIDVDANNVIANVRCG